MLHPDLVLVGLDAPDAEYAIRRLAERLAEHGCVRETFASAVLEREKQFPTGLPTSIPVAIPHTDAVHCLRPAIAVGVLARPVVFGEMGNPEGSVNVRIIFLLSVPDPSQQVIWLQKLVDAFQRPGFLEALVASRDAAEAYVRCNEVLST